MKPKISVVTALYRSAPFIREFYARHLVCLQKLGVEYEFIFVNDGSPDNSGDVVRELIPKDQHVRLVSLSRNFGQHPAMFAGLAQASGDYVYALDCDLEEDPENILQMYDKIRSEKEVDVVYGVIEKRPGSMFRNFFAGLFYFTLDMLSDIKVPHDQAWQRIMTRNYTNALLKYQEVETLPAGLMILAGFKQVPFVIRKSYKGSTSYTIRKRIKLAVNSITAFSAKPLVFIGIIGMSITVLAFLAIVAIFIKKMTSSDFQSGWLSIMASIWCIGGLILSSIGIIGIYLAKIFNQIKNRPLYIIRSIESSDQNVHGS